MRRNPLLLIALLAVPLAGLLALTAAGPAPAAVTAPSYAAGNPNPVVTALYDANNNMSYVFWRCPDTFSLCGARTISARNHTYVKFAIPGMGMLESVPSASVDVDRTGRGGAPYIYVFWEAGYPKYDLTEAYYDGSWHGPISLGMGKMLSGPAAPQAWFTSGDSVGPSERNQVEGVAWMGAQYRLMYATSDNPANRKSWKGPYYDGVTVASTPTVADGGGGAEVAFWDGTGNHLYAASFPFDWPELNGGRTAKFGPCEFDSMGVLGSNPSAAWFQGIQIGDGKRGGPGGSPASGGTTARVVSGNCPVSGGIVSFGDQGSWQVCWSGDKPPGKNIYCMQWLQPPTAEQTIFGPTRLGNYGVLGSAPSVTEWPIDNLNSDATSAFWQGSNGAQDLYRAVIIPPSRAVNLGFGPLSGG